MLVAAVSFQVSKCNYFLLKVAANSNFIHKDRLDAIQEEMYKKLTLCRVTIVNGINYS